MTKFKDGVSAGVNLCAHDERLSLLADCISHMVWSTDFDGAFDFVNARWTEYTRDVLPRDGGGEFFSHVHPDDRARTRTVFLKGIGTGSEFEIEIRLRRWDGVYRWHLSRGTPYVDPNGKVARVVGACIDIDDAKRATAALRESEQRFRDIAENISEVFWLSRVDHTTIYVSPAYEKIWGRPASSCYEDDFVFIDAVHEEDRKRVESTLDKHSEGYDVEYRIVRPDGEIRWIHDRAFPVRDESGVVVRVTGIAEDITARRSMELDNRMQAHLLASVRQAIISTDTKGEITSWNRHAEMIYGWSAREAIGQNVARLLFPEVHPDTPLDMLVQALEGGTEVDRERQVRRKDGSLIWVSVTASPVVDSNGNVTHMVGAAIDITERLRLEQQFRQSQKMEAVGRLAGGVAHDFNNLLTVIKGHAEFLSRELPPDGQSREDIEQITRASQRAGALTKQLMAFSRQQVLEKQIVDPNSLLSELEKMLSRVIGEDVALHVALGRDVPTILADAGQLEQAVMNLVVNARDAMPDGGHLTLQSRMIKLTAQQSLNHPGSTAGDHVAISVSDSGTGMAPELLSKIFEPFFTTKGAGRGTGLGLATVYGIAQQSGGFVDVSSTVGKGSVFTICIPASRIPVTPGERTAVGASNRGEELILLVEDQDEVRAVARRILLTHGYRVIEARNGVEALDILDGLDAGVDLVLTDAVMPQMGGPDLIRKLRAVRADLPVVMASGYTDHELITYGAAGLDVPFLHKPFRAEDLLRIIRNALDS